MSSIFCPIFIIGFMVSGKSTVGKQLAEELNLPFIDLDEYIAREEEASIDQIFAMHGEDHFRQIERKALHNITKTPRPLIVATGGGTPCHFDNMQRMLTSGVVIYLHLTNSQIVKRLNATRRAKRPLLATLSQEDVPGYVEQIMAQRTPFYEQAHVTVDANHFNISSLAMMAEMVLDGQKGRHA